MATRCGPAPGSPRGARRWRRSSSRTACTTRGSRPCGPPAAGRPETSTTSHPTPDVLVDGIVGIGGRPGLRPDAVAALDHFPGVPVVAVDVPSGVDVDGGTLDGPHVRADLTVTFGTHKVAHLVDPASPRERRRPPRRPRPRRLGPRSAGGRGPPARRRARPAAAARRRRAQVHPRRGRRPRGLGHLPGCRAARRVRRELRAGRDGPLRRAGCDRRHRAQRAPRGRRRRPGPGLGGGPRRW